MPDDIWTLIRSLVAEGEPGRAVDVFSGWLKGRLSSAEKQRVRQWLTELVVQAARVNRIEAELRRGTVGRADANVMLADVSYSVLKLVDIVEASDGSLAFSPTPGFDPGELPDDLGHEKIIGSRSHLQKIHWLEIGLLRSSAICRLVSAAKLGTGFRISNDLMITNNHVIATVDEGSRFKAQFFYEERLDGNITTGAMVEVDPRRFWTSKDLDVTVVGGVFTALDNGPHITPIRLVPGKKPSAGDPVSIIQHPMGGPKQIAFTSNEIVNILDSRVQYVTDTMPGSSGAPVFDLDWNVVAVHHAGGMLRKDRSGAKHFVNEGISVGALLASEGFAAMIGAQ